MKGEIAYVFELLKIKKMIILFAFIFLCIGVHAEVSVIGTNTGQKLSDAVPGLSCVVDLWPNISITADRKNSMFQSYSLFVRGTIEYKYNAELFLFKTVLDKEINLMLRQRQFDGSLGTVMNDNTFKQQVDELYIMYGEEDGTHVSLGKKVVRWGEFKYYQQVNFLSPQKDPLDDTAPLEGYIMAEATVNMLWDKVKWQSAFLPRMPQDERIEYYSAVGKYDIVSRLSLDLGFLGLAASARIADTGKVFLNNFGFGVEGYIIFFDVVKTYAGFTADYSKLHEYLGGMGGGFEILILDDLYLVCELFTNEKREHDTFENDSVNVVTRRLEWRKTAGNEKLSMSLSSISFTGKECLLIDGNYNYDNNFKITIRNMFEYFDDKNNYVVELRLQMKI